jgi:phosphatidylinositol-3-phosphatase
MANTNREVRMRIKNLFIFLIIITLGMGSFAIAKLNGAEAPKAQRSPSVSAISKGQVKHVFIVLEENQNYSKVIGNMREMPYLNSLANKYACAKNYYANTHPSIGNYFMLTAGKIISNYSGFSDTVNDDNIVRHLLAAGKTWKEYSEDLPFVGYTGGSRGSYCQRHNPLSYYSDVRENRVQSKNLVPFSQLAVDITSHNLPDYAFIVPNNINDAHSGDNRLAKADYWLKQNIDPLLQSPDFNTLGGGLLIITFDEASNSDRSYGGGHIAWVIVGPDVKKGYTSNTFYQHENTLRFMSEMLGLSNFPGKAASAASMKEFIQGN